jgi:hypothetical protein
MILTFSFEVVSGHTITIQWYKDDVAVADGTFDGVVVAGSTTNTMTITDPTTAWDGEYYAIVTDSTAECTTQTDPVDVTVPNVECALAITTQPVSEEINEGATLELTVAATGAVGTVTYQWYLDGVALEDGPSGAATISGATTATLTITDFTVALEGNYTVILIDTNFADCSVESDAATVSILYPLAILDVCGAYSTARRLRSDYAGDAFRVRRSSDNTDLDIGFVGDEVDTASLLTFAGAGDASIIIWYDQSTCGHNMTVIDSDHRPKIVVAGALQSDANGKPWMVLDANQDDGLFTSITSTVAATRFCVFSAIAHADTRVIHCGTAWYEGSVQQVGVDQLGLSGSAAAASPGPTYFVDVQYLVTAHLTGGAGSTIQLNTNLITTVNTGPFTFGVNAQVGYAATPGGRSFNGRISEFYNVEGVVADPERTEFQQNILDYFGL